MTVKLNKASGRRRQARRALIRRGHFIERLEERALLAGDSSLIQLMIHPRTGDDTAFSPSAFNASTRELTVGVDEIFHLEVSFSDLRIPADRLGAFTVFADVLFERGVGAGVIEPVLTETQFVELSPNFLDATDGSLLLAFDDNPDNLVSINFQDFQADPENTLSAAISELGFPNAEVTVRLSQFGTPTVLMVRFKDTSVIDLDLPNLTLLPLLHGSSGEQIIVTTDVRDFPPRLSNGDWNSRAILYNLDFDSRTMSGNPDERSGESFFSHLVIGDEAYQPDIGFRDIGGVGAVVMGGYPGLGRGPLPQPFDAFSVPVRIRQPVENLTVYLDPPNTPSTAILLYGTVGLVPNDLVKIDLNVDPLVPGSGTGMLFVSAVPRDEVAVLAGDGSIIAEQNGGPVSINLLALTSVTGTTAPAEISLVSQPGFGSVIISNSIATYFPDDNFVGTTSFTYAAAVGDASDSGVITVTVIGSPSNEGDQFEPNDTFQTAYDAGVLSFSSFIDELSIHSPSDRDFFRFETLASADHRHFVEIAFDHSRGDLDMRLFDADGNQLAISNGVGNTERISFDGRPAGVYVLEVFGFLGATNDYSISFSAPESTLPQDRYEPNDSISSATDFGKLWGVNSFNELTIHNASDRDFFRFETSATGVEGNFVAIFFDHAAGDIDMRLRDSQGVVIASSTSVLDFESISLQGLQAGVYFLEVYGFAGAANRYDLFIAAPEDVFPPDRFESNDSRQTATNLGEIVGPLHRSGLSIHNATDRDFFRFETVADGRSGHFVEVTFMHTAGDIDLLLWDNAGNIVGSSLGVVNSERISLQGLPAGVYFMEVYGFAGAVNQYDLNINAPVVVIPPDRFEPNDSLATATNLRVVEGMVRQSDLSIHDTSDRDFFRFELARGGTSGHFVQVDFNHSAGDIDVRLFDSNGNWIASSTGVTNQEFLSLQGLAAGVYFLEVFGYSGATNRYDLLISAPQASFPPDRFEPNNSIESAADLRNVVGQVRQQGLTIDSGQDVDFFRFETVAVGGPNDFVQVNFSHAVGDIDIRLLDSNGRFLAGSFSVTDTEQVSLMGRAAGVYYLQVYGFNGATNQYDLLISAPTATIPADRFEPNNQLSSATDLRQLSGTARIDDLSIHQAGDRDFFRFETLATGTALSSIAIDFRHNQGNLNANLYDANQNLIAQANSTTDNETISMSELPAGVYFLEVFGLSSAVNRYGLTIVAPVGPQGLQPDRFESNDTLQAATDLRELDHGVSLDSLTIHNANDRDIFRFTTLSRGTAENFAEIRFAHAVGNLDMRLLDANGNLVRAASSVSDNERISLDGLPAATYFVEVFGVDGALSPYQLVIQPPSRAGFSIEVVFPANHGFTARQQDIIRQSAARWEQIIIGDLPPVLHSDGTIIDDVRIQFSARNDLPANVLGRAFQPLVRPESRLPYFGRTEYSTQFLATRTDTQFLQTVNHEIAHILGMFSSNILIPLGLVINHDLRLDSAGNVISHNPNVRYVGPQAVAQFQQIFNTNQTFIPLENRPWPGSYGSHWPEWFGPEVVMTFGGAPISPITVGVMADVGYRVNMNAADDFFAPPNTPPVMAMGEGEAFVFYGALHHGLGHDHDDWEMIYEEETVDPGEVLDLLPFEATIRPDDFDLSLRSELSQSQYLSGLSIHDPALWNQIGTMTDHFGFTLESHGHSSQFVRVEPGRVGMQMVLRLFAADDTDRLTVLAESDELVLTFESLAAGSYVIEVSGQVGTYDLEIDLGRPLTSDRLVGTFWGEVIELDLLQSAIAIGAPLSENPIEILSDPSVGTVTLIDGGRIRFDAGQEFLGDATFEYRVFNQVGELSEPSTVTIRINGNPLQNALVSADVLNNDRVEPLDALLILTRLATAAREGVLGSIPIDSLVDEMPRFFYDVDGNGRVEPLDALLVLTHIARESRGVVAEGEFSGPTETPRSQVGQEPVVPWDVSMVEEPSRELAVDILMNDDRVAWAPMGIDTNEEDDEPWDHWMEITNTPIVKVRSTSARPV